MKYLKESFYINTHQDSVTRVYEPDEVSLAKCFDLQNHCLTDSTTVWLYMRSKIIFGVRILKI